MKIKLLYLVFYIILGFVIEILNELVDSNYLINLYKNSFFSILVTLTVFSYTMFTYISGKMSKLELEYDFKFNKTRKELKDAFQILVFLDIAFIILLMLCFSKLSESNFSNFVLMCALNTLFICVVHILIDLGNSIFKMFDFIGKFKKNENS